MTRPTRPSTDPARHRLRPAPGRSVLSLAIVAAIVLCVVAALVPAAPELGAAGGFEADVALAGSPSSTPGTVDAGGSVDAVLSLEGPPTAAQVTGIADISEGLTLEPSSVEVPSGWGTSFSSTGPTGPFDDPLDTATDAIEVRSPMLPGNGLGATQPAPSTAMVADVGVANSRGFLPVLAGNRVFNVLHHSGPDDLELDCADRVTGVNCPGYPMELHVNAPGDMYTAFAATGWVDDADRLWFAGVRDLPGTADEGGFYCFDTTTDTPCAQRWHPLTQVTAGSAGVNQGRAPVSMIGRDDTRLYLVSMRAGAPSAAQRVTVSCFDTATTSACGQTHLGDAATTPSWESVAVTLRAPRLLSHQSGDRMFFVIDYGLYSLESDAVFGGSPSRMLCFDASTGQRCAGWPAAAPAVPATSGTDVFRSTGALFTNPADAGGVCAVVSRAQSQFVLTTSGLLLLPVIVARTPYCFSGSGVSGAGPAGLQTLINTLPTRVGAANSPGQQPVVVTHSATAADNKLYIPAGSVAQGAATSQVNSWLLCYDVAAGAACSGFGTSGGATFPALNNGAIELYGSTVDAAGCLWATAGDANGWTFSIDPDTGSAPCASTAATVSVSASSFYCAPGVTYDWSAVTVAGVDPSEVATTTVTVRDTAGNPVPGYTDRSAVGATVDLLGLPAGPDYTFDVTVVLFDPAAVLDPALVEVAFTGPPAQICFTAAVDDTCDAPDTVTVGLDAVTSTALSSNATSSLVVELDDDCSPSTTTSTTTTVAPPASTPPTTTPPTTGVPSTTVPPTTVPPTTGTPTTTSTPATPTMVSTGKNADVDGAGASKGTPRAPAAGDTADLAFTGSAVAGTVGAALALIGVGIAVLAVRRRRTD